MTQYIKITFSRNADHAYRNGLPGPLFDLLAAHFPSGLNTPDFFKIELQDGSEELEALYKFLLVETKLTPKLNQFQPGGCPENNWFRVYGRRSYTKAEIANAEFCQFCGSRNFCDSNSSNESGIQIISSGEIKKQSVGAGNNFTETFCTNEIREVLTTENFKGLAFREVIIQRSRKKDAPPVWQIWSQDEMPLMKSKKSDSKGRIIELDDDDCRGCYVDDLFIPGLVRYDKSLLTELQGIDVIRSVEHFGGGVKRSKRTPLLFGSKRFREWCTKKKLPFSWVPVEFS